MRVAERVDGSAVGAGEAVVVEALLLPNRPLERRGVPADRGCLRTDEGEICFSIFVDGVI